MVENSQNIHIRPMCIADIDTITKGRLFPWSTIQETESRWKKYYQEQQVNERTVGIIEKDQQILGYGSLFLKSEYPHFSHIPEINDLWIFEEHRGKGLGSQLIAWLENIAKEKGYKEVGIGVGLYADYGSAQKLYFKLGYSPDGKGITYKYQPTIPGVSYPLDDELILWLKKSLFAKPE